MSNPFIEDAGPQPPRMLSAPLEILSSLRLLLQGNDPLLITFKGRSQRFQSYLVEINRERALIALDELVPGEGERFLEAGEAFRVEAFHEGIRIAWDSADPVQPGEWQGSPCYWCHLPEQVLYHQRRNAYRANLLQSQLINAQLSDPRLEPGLSGQMLDISATGCRLRFSGDVGQRLQAGQLYERLDLALPAPFGPIALTVELRHTRYEDKTDQTFAGIRFHQVSGQAQRLIERFVYQLQREARRFD